MILLVLAINQNKWKPKANSILRSIFHLEVNAHWLLRSMHFLHSTRSAFHITRKFPFVDAIRCAFTFNCSIITNNCVWIDDSRAVNVHFPRAIHFCFLFAQWRRVFYGWSRISHLRRLICFIGISIAVSESLTYRIIEQCYRMISTSIRN